MNNGSQSVSKEADWLAVGDIGVIVYKLNPYSRSVIGDEVAVILAGQLPYIETTTGRAREALGYYGRLSDGRVSFFFRDQLRRKRPPSEPLGRWEDVPYFNPTRVRA